MKKNIIGQWIVLFRHSEILYWYYRFTRIAFIFLFIHFLLLPSALAWDHSPIEVVAQEDGRKFTGLEEIWHDKSGQSGIEEALQAYEQRDFSPLDSAGSSGIQPGTFWSHFALRNNSNQSIKLHVEYVDHQLLGLQAYSRQLDTVDPYRQLADLSIYAPFDSRQVEHNRFVFEISIPALSTQELMVKFDSGELGVVFPSMRIWSPQNLQKNSKGEVSLLSFLFGGYFLMALFALVGAITVKEKLLYFYSLYCASKILVWGTVLGYTHQYLLRGDFHWGYASLSSAVAILTGLIFARIFLETRRYTPRLDYLLKLMMANGGFLLLCVLLEFKALSQFSMTIALLCYPLVVPIALVRWCQGNSAAAVFAIGWTTLVLGLVVQAMRDLGFVVHNPVNYYWPPVASFVEILAIMAAIGLMVQRLRTQKEQAEKKYLQQLEVSKADLEHLVQLRTQELETAKAHAELEARTDPLTGIYNRRSFFEESGLLLKLAQRKHIPLGLLMLDIDHFKSINDIHGHLIGDQALCATARVIAEHVRDVDVFGRIGGEEFALLVSADAAGTVKIARRIHRGIARIDINSAQGAVRFTASIGVACLNGEIDILELLQQADSALYQAKRTGRNRILEFSPADISA